MPATVRRQWFEGGRTNLCYNALDRWVERGEGGRTAVVWEGNSPGRTRTFTYLQLLQRVSEVAQRLRAMGVAKGDFVTIYMPMVAELPIAMLACARIGAVHSVGCAAHAQAHARACAQPSCWPPTACQGLGAQEQRGGEYYAA